MALGSACRCGLPALAWRSARGATDGAVRANGGGDRRHGACDQLVINLFYPGQHQHGAREIGDTWAHGLGGLPRLDGTGGRAATRWAGRRTSWAGRRTSCGQVNSTRCGTALVWGVVHPHVAVGRRPSVDSGQLNSTSFRTTLVFWGVYIHIYCEQQQQQKFVVSHQPCRSDPSDGRQHDRRGRQ